MTEMARVPPESCARALQGVVATREPSAGSTASVSTVLCYPVLRTRFTYFLLFYKWKARTSTGKKDDNHFIERVTLLEPNDICDVSLYMRVTLQLPQGQSLIGETGKGTHEATRALHGAGGEGIWLTLRRSQ